MANEIKGYCPPWSSEGPDDFGDFNVHCTGESAVVAAVVSNCRPPEITAANAELIVRAVNSHQKLVDALEIASAALWDAGKNGTAREIDAVLDSLKAKESSHD